MLSLLFGSQKGRRNVNRTTISSYENPEQSPLLNARNETIEERRGHAPNGGGDGGRLDNRATIDQAEIHGGDGDDIEDNEELEDEDGEVELATLLPLFSAAHLGISGHYPV